MGGLILFGIVENVRALSVSYVAQIQTQIRDTRFPKNGGIDMAGYVTKINKLINNIHFKPVETYINKYNQVSFYKFNRKYLKQYTFSPKNQNLHI